MSASFWIFFTVCVISFIPVCIDHGKTWGAFQKSRGKAKIAKGLLVAVLWTTPVLTLIGTFVSGHESYLSESAAPQNQPIRTATAIARFSVSGFDLNRIVVGRPPFSQFVSHSEGRAFLGFAVREEKLPSCRLLLLGNDLKITSNQCLMSFTLTSLQAKGQSSLDSAEKTLALFDKCMWYVGCVQPLTNAPLKVEITEGEVILVLNTFVEKKFVIPKQPLFGNTSCAFLIGVESSTNAPRISVEIRGSGDVK